jgi:hypothetical protein
MSKQQRSDNNSMSKQQRSDNNSMSKQQRSEERCRRRRHVPVAVDEFLDVRSPISTNIHEKPVAIYKRAFDPMHGAFS